MAAKVFLITGTSTGFGFELVNICLANGAHVIATSRKSSTLTGKFSQANESNLLLVDLDVTNNESIDKAFETGLSKFGRIDVVVNNAGYGLSGEFESFSEEQLRKQMEVNFFGLIKVTRKAMEVMRERQKPTGGVIQNVTSIGGQKGVPTFSMCEFVSFRQWFILIQTDCASKWAVEGFTESVAQEVKPEWGIKFTLIEPGGFRTDWAGPSMEFGAHKHPAYDHIDAETAMGKRNGTQAGDPKKGAQAFYDLAVMENPPLRCIVGTDAYAMINTKLEQYAENIKKYEKLSTSTDVDGYVAPK
jgi:NAD(P)-dependent dehydrogenase (short-subunit alcohol dehydrogenase family)